MSEIIPQTRFEIRDERFHEIIPADAKLAQLAGGFVFTEGPIWNPKENWLLFSDIAESKQYKWSATGGTELFRTPSNQANGNCFDPVGNVISCEHATSQLVICDHGGKRIKTLASHFQEKELNSPNDVVCDSKGRLWFTDPVFGRTREDLGVLRDQELAHQGVYRLDPDGTLDLVVKDFQQPNGLCFSLDEKHLYINDSPAGTIRKFEVHDDGSLTGGEVWAELTGDSPWVPDGMKVDVMSNIFCNGPGGVHIFTPSAECLGVILMPEKSTNFCFGGPKNSTLFITASTHLYAIGTNTSAPVAHCFSE